jgi:adenylate cyclase, class 2
MKKHAMSSDNAWEAECKYRVADIERTRSLLSQCGAELIGHESHRDTYLRHPCRDFRETNEALRLREVDGKPMITYKGPRIAGPIKIRPEIELPLVQETMAGWQQIWKSLGFEIALVIVKQRATYRVLPIELDLTVTLDIVEGLGNFAEIERIIYSRSAAVQAEKDIQSYAVRIGLSDVEPKSYLGMLLDLANHSVGQQITQ